MFRGAVQAHIPTWELRQRLRLNHRITDERGWRLILDELVLNEESWAANHVAQEKAVDALIRLAFLRYEVGLLPRDRRTCNRPPLLRRGCGDPRRVGIGLGVRGSYC